MKIPKEMIITLIGNREIHIKLIDAKFISPNVIETKIRMSTDFIKNHIKDCVEIKFKEDNENT